MSFPWRIDSCFFVSMMTIALKDALREMDRIDEKGNPVPFSIEFCTCDENRKTGGELIFLEGVVLARNVKKIPRYVRKESTPGKKANEWQSATRNILIPSSGEIRKCSIHLITMFNGKPTRY